MIWLRGENGALLSFSEPLPAFIQSKLDKGEMQRAEAPPERPVPAVPAVPPVPPPAQDAEDAAEPPADAAARRPSVRASATAWRAYAVSQGMPRGKASAMTKQHLITEYTRLRAVS